ncbi:efflux RND transporter periplasmic adaptor subunit [Hymenobacter sp. NBH84]|uniref:Efflux RND transporter periplasmic adaptor subunit n=1 Tax=Hymenobacter defluvii TaxID=2054411 RepID=A0ABS3TBB3_9BACT|nr:efflux RND transporter periplasmic adaptor subunit [Hymenobacter sp. NBH84]MBO3270952.1 efflux RND transporter periplasmic adaptor subunit [Hymenobacter defluvii]QNE39662.1 efflux RND transporter periplasmic adaptor subunit [Hymenobacter sp. NBH84]
MSLSDSSFRQFFWFVLPLAAATLGSCSEKSQADTNKSDVPEVPVVQLAPRDTVLHHDYVADIEAVRNVDVRARVPGFLEHIYVDEGQVVKKGQPLFRINASEYKERLASSAANVRNAQAQEQVAELELNRVQMLVKKNIIASSELDVAQAKLRAAQAMVREARATQANANFNLSYTLIKAPFDGIIDRIPLKTGSLVDNGTLLTSVSDLGAVYAYFNVAENEYLEYAKTRQRTKKSGHDSVTLVLADGTPYRHGGRIETMEGEFEETTGSIAFRARFPNPEGLLKHNASGRVRLQNEVKDALLVPQRAVFETQDKNYVFVVGQNGKIKQQSFTPQARLSDFYVVKSGLKAGERIVYEGVQDLRDGNTIQSRPVTMKTLLAEAQ